MPTIEVPRERLQPKVTPAIPVAPSAFGAEARAVQKFGGALEYFGSELARLGERIDLAEAQDQYDDGYLEYAKLLDEQNTELGRNPKYTRDIWETNHDTRTAKILEETDSSRARKELTKYFNLQRVRGGIRTEVSIHRLRTAEARQKIPFVVNSYAQEFVDDDTPEGQKEILSCLTGKLSNDVSSGVLSEAEAQDTFRRFTMMSVREYAESNPKRAAVAVKSRASLKKELELTDEMIASLSAEDLDELQKDANSEIEGRKAEIVVADKIAFEEADDEYRNVIIKGDFSDATYLKIKNDQRFDNFGKERGALLKWRTDWIKGINENAKTLATDTQKGEAEDKFDELVETRKFEDAKKIFAENAWMFTRTENKAMWDSIGKAKDEPMDNLLTASIGISNKITELRVKEIDEDKVVEERIEGRNRNARLREIAADPNKTNKQKQEEMDALLLPAQEEIVLNWFERLMWIKRPQLFGLVGTQAERLAKKKAKAGIVEEPEKSPYPEYPDAFSENGIWKVIRGGETYRIED